MTRKSEEILANAIAAWGKTEQIDVAIEEMAELTRELLHERRGREAHVAEEMADVEIMLCQLEIIFGNSAEVERIKAKKIDRLAQRIFEEDNAQEGTEQAERLKKATELMRTHVGTQIRDTAYRLEQAIAEQNNQEEDVQLGKWEAYQSVLGQFSGLDFHFTRTAEYFGICTEDEKHFLLKVERKL